MTVIRRGFWELKAEALDYFLGRTRFGRSCGTVVRQIMELLLLL
jgi:hypothetical protein